MFGIEVTYLIIIRTIFNKCISNTILNVKKKKNKPWMGSLALTSKARQRKSSSFLYFIKGLKVLQEKN